jgi:hypothetical protein
MIWWALLPLGCTPVEIGQTASLTPIAATSTGSDGAATGVGTPSPRASIAEAMASQTDGATQTPPATAAPPCDSPGPVPSSGPVPRPTTAPSFGPGECPPAPGPPRPTPPPLQTPEPAPKDASLGWHTANVDGGKGVLFNDVISAGTGFVAVSSRYEGSGEGRTQSQLWRSADGHDWRRDPGLAFLPDTNVAGVATDGSLAYLAMGWTGQCPIAEHCSLGRDEGVNLWMSTDGRTWNREAQDPNIRSAATRMLVHTPAGWAITGDEASPWNNVASTASIWTSVDGLNWIEAFRDASGFRVGAMAVGPDGVITLASRVTGSRGRDAVAVVSVDGVTFVEHPITSDPDVFLSDVSAAPDGGWVAVGSHAIEDATDGFCPAVVAAVYTSRDGIRWTEAPVQPSLGLAGIDAVAIAEGGLVAVGTTCFGDWSWWSKDARTWTATPVFAPPSASHGRKLSGFPLLAAGTNGIVANRMTILDVTPEWLYAAYPARTP